MNTFKCNEIFPDELKDEIDSGTPNVDVQIVMDPLKQFGTCEPNALETNAGVLIDWLRIAFGRFVGTDVPMNDTLNELYGIGSNLLDRNGMIHENGVFEYPGDPLQFPIVGMSCCDNKAFIYLHAFLAWKDKSMNGFHMTRMD